MSIHVTAGRLALTFSGSLRRHTMDNLVQLQLNGVAVSVPLADLEPAEKQFVARRLGLYSAAQQVFLQRLSWFKRFRKLTYSELRSRCLGRHGCTKTCEWLVVSQQYQDEAKAERIKILCPEATRVVFKRHQATYSCPGGAPQSVTKNSVAVTILQNGVEFTETYEVTEEVEDASTT